MGTISYCLNDRIKKVSKSKIAVLTNRIQLIFIDKLGTISNIKDSNFALE